MTGRYCSILYLLLLVSFAIACSGDCSDEPNTGSDTCQAKYGDRGKADDNVPHDFSAQTIRNDFEQYRLAAMEGDSESQFKLGTFYEFGRGGVEKDESEGFEWYYKAAQQGHPQAQTNLGGMYEKGCHQFLLMLFLLVLIERSLIT